MPENKQGASSTQQFVEVEDIRSGTVILRGGALRKILMVSGVNFDLKSEEEQNLILATFQSFLNSLSFSVQLVVHSRKLNIDGYLDGLSSRASQEPNELLRGQITEYQTFIKELVQENAIMAKTYFVVVPYDPVGLSSIGTTAKRGLFGFGKKKDASALASDARAKEEKFREHIEQLSQRVDQVVNSLNQTELRAVPLNDEELIELFYNLYNPGTVEKREIQAAKQ
jgi:type IV secretory pathway VirB4 component